MNTHLVFQDCILAEEYERVGLPYKRQAKRFLDYAASSYQEANRITVPSNFARQTFIDLGVSEDKLAVVPYGVNLNRFHPIAKRHGTSFRVLFVGQLSIRKGIHDLMDAFRMASIPSSELIFVGSTTPEVEVLLKRQPAPSRQVVGPQPKSILPKYYSSADVMVLPSIEEGLALVIGEAMACGCPVIATTNTGGPDLFTDGVEGFVVPIRSPEAIADKLVWLWEHPDERHKMSQAALKRVQSIGGWDSYGEQMLALFQRVIGRG